MNEAVFGFWGFLAFVVFLSFVHKMFRLRYNRNVDDSATRQQREETGARIRKLEERVANLETVMLESEKHRRFEQELSAAGSRDSYQGERSNVQ
jgi:hypothetical protein